MIQESDKAPSLLRTRRYGLFWVSSLLSNIGTWMQQVAQPWVVLSLSNSSFWVGLDSFAMNAPAFLFILWGGILADRYDRRKIILFFQAIQFLCVAVMLTLLVMGLLKVWMIVIISFLVGLTDSLSVPAFQSIIPSLVKPTDIPHAVSLNSAQFNLSRILGPMIAGIVIVKYGVAVCFGANAVSYIPFFLSLYFIYPKGGMKKKEAIEGKPIPQVKEFKNLLQNRAFRLPLIAILISNLFCGPIITFCSVLIKNGFHAEAESFGGAMSALGAGGLIGAAVTFISLPAYISRSVLATGVAALLGLLVIAIGLNHSLLLLYILLVLAGISLTASNISVNTFLQESASDANRGRVASLYQLALHGGVSLGSLLMGFVSSKWNISVAFTVNGILAVLLLAWLLRKQLK